MAMLTHSSFTSRGHARTLVSLIGLVLIAGVAIPSYWILHAEVRDGLASSFAMLKVASADGAIPLAELDSPWLARKMSRREEHAYGSGFRITYLYRDGHQVVDTRGQRGQADRTLMVIDPEARQVRVAILDQGGRLTGLRLVHYDDRMQIPQSEETAEADALIDGVPVSQTVRTMDAAGAVDATVSRAAVSADFAATAHRVAEDLRFFAASGR